MDEVEAGKSRTWSAPNLTSADIGLAKWSVDDLQKYLKSGSSRRAGVFGPMNEVIANSLRYLTDADAAAMAVYIKSLPAAGESSHQTLSADERAAGQALYDKHCDECHLSTGRGGFRKAPPVARQPNRAGTRRLVPSQCDSLRRQAGRGKSECLRRVGRYAGLQGQDDRHRDSPAGQLFADQPGAIKAAECRRRPWPHSVSSTTDLRDYRNRIWLHCLFK